MFDRCCGTKDVRRYTIIHKTKPLKVSLDVDELLKRLLLYNPNISSYQSEQNSILRSALYGQIIFDYFLYLMEMDEDTDVQWRSGKDYIPDTDVKFYQDEMCVNCQKIIVCKNSDTKINNVLRALRNTVAHGEFIVENGYLIGFNRLNVWKDEKYTAVVKVKLDAIDHSLSLISARDIKERVIGFAFEKIGYTVIRNSNIECDLVIEKNGKRYAIEIKSFEKLRYFHLEHIEEQIIDMQRRMGNLPFILFVDSSRITKEVRNKYFDNTNIRVMDANNLSQLFNGIDILEM